MNISVAIATYNGAQYIREQLDSILIQLDAKDEIVIYDDGSTDETLDIVEKYCKSNKNIKLFRGTNIGFVKNFERAISECTNDIICLCDQDDIWNENKLAKIRNHFSITSKCVYMHNASLYDSELNTILEEEKLIPNMKHGVFQNLIKSCYWGCCIAFRKEFVNYIIPFPQKLISHDQWIGLIAEDLNQAEFEDCALISHRCHSMNVSKKLKVFEKLMFRANIFGNYIKYVGGKYGYFKK